MGEYMKNNKVVSHIIGNREFSLILILIISTLGMGIVSPYFLKFANLNSILLGLTVEGIMVIGMAILLISGGLDLSIGSTMCLTGVITGLCISANIPIFISMCIGLLFAIGVGFINGFLIAKLNLNPFITTLGMSITVRGILLIISNGKSVLNLPDAYNIIGRGKLFSIQNPIYVMIILVIIMDQVIKKNPYFRQSYYVGGNEKAAKLNGINVKKVKLVNYMITAALSGIVGIMITARFGSASVTIGQNTALNVITAAIIGGASLNGGKGTVFGAFLGAVFLQVLSSSLNLLGVDINYQSLITGLILIGAIIMDVLNEKNPAKA